MALEQLQPGESGENLKHMMKSLANIQFGIDLKGVKVMLKKRFMVN